MRKEEKREKRTKRKEKTRLTVFGTKLDCQRWLIGPTARQTLSKTLRLPYLPVTVTQSGGSSGPQVRGILALPWLLTGWLVCTYVLVQQARFEEGTSRPATFPAGPIRAPGHRGTSLGSRISFLIGCSYFVLDRGGSPFFFWTINSSRRPESLKNPKGHGLLINQSRNASICAAVCRTPHSANIPFFSSCRFAVFSGLNSDCRHLQHNFVE